MFTVLYVAAVMPIEVAFLVHPMEQLDTAVDVLVVSDVCLQFFQGYFDRGFPVLEIYFIAKRYACTWFVVDLAASIPFDWFVNGVTFSEPEVCWLGLT
jgi:hypothetical protein